VSYNLAAIIAEKKVFEANVWKKKFGKKILERSTKVKFDADEPQFDVED
jgi:hypothetical protein